MNGTFAAGGTLDKSLSNMGAPDLNNLASMMTQVLPSAVPQEKSASSMITQMSLTERAASTIYVCDLPLSTQYLDLVECFERRIGPCDIVIKRSLFKNFHFAFVMFKDPSHAKKAVQEMRYPTIRGAECRVLPYTLKFAKVQSKNGDKGSNSDDLSTYIFVKGF